jgi:nitrile hydratase
MDGAHDMGGMHGFGPVPEANAEAVFPEEWQGRVFATNLAILAITGGNVDRWRHHIESMPPAEYLAASYYERWLASTLATALENDILDIKALRDIEAGLIPSVDKADVEPLPPEITLAMVDAPVGKTTDMSGEPAYRPGAKVRTAITHTAGHTRLPRYARGRLGTVVSDNGNHHLADARAADGTIEMQRLYTVCFTARELWGDSAHPRDTVRLDLWESYLEPA